jgi:hypothetical protein
MKEEEEDRDPRLDIGLKLTEQNQIVIIILCLHKERLWFVQSKRKFHHLARLEIKLGSSNLITLFSRLYRAKGGGKRDKRGAESQEK